MLYCRILTRHGPCKNRAHKDHLCSSHLHSHRLNAPDTCCICLDMLSKHTTPLHCGHYLHTQCCRALKRRHCPLCRAHLHGRYRTKTSPTTTAYEPEMILAVLYALCVTTTPDVYIQENYEL